jgi:hypothetical protein
MGTYGQELLGDAFGQMLGAITILCGALCGTPPTSIVGAILWAGYFGQAVLAHLHAGNLPIAFVSLGVCLALMVRGAPALRNRSLRHIDAIQV